MNRQKIEIPLRIRGCFCTLILCVMTSMSTTAFSQNVVSKVKNIFHQDSYTGAISSDSQELQTILLSSSQPIIVALPLPNGSFVNFELTLDSVMAEGLVNKYPNIRTFSGVSVDNPNHRGRFDITPNGFHGMFYYQGERIFVEPKSVFLPVLLNQDLTKTKLKEIRADEVTPLKIKRAFDGKKNLYNSYVKESNRLKNRAIHKFHQSKKVSLESNFLVNTEQKKSSKVTSNISTESVIKTYRIAISAAAEYTKFIVDYTQSTSDPVDAAMAEIITLVNRLNVIYQRDLSIRLELVENNDLLIFTNSNSDPFNNDSFDGDLNTNVIDRIIGNSSYDVGHILNTDGGGLAVLGAACHPVYKGDGVTGDSIPTNDAFYIDYVAHELGHQFGANHTFNGSGGFCKGNRVWDSAYEVGSGSTIMAYAGICGDQNLQTHSDAFFHARSIEQIMAHLQSDENSSCGVVTGDINQVPIVDAGSDYTIPARTPFKLSGSAQDAENDNLSYSWQQFDLGQKSASRDEQTDDGTRPLFRAFLPTDRAERYFPQLSDVLSGTQTIGESLPTTNRELNFRLMAFDNQGGASFDETKLTVIDSGEAFSLNTPVAESTWTESNNNISWQVAETNNMPVNCTEVDVLLSQNNGESFDITLANNITNNGNSDISIDSFCANDINTSQARLKLMCSNNVFYAVNKGKFSIEKAISAKDISITSQQPITLLKGDSVEITTSLFTYTCETADSITIKTGDDYTIAGQVIMPNSDFIGELLVPVVANKGTVSSASYTLNINVDSEPEPPKPTKSGGSMTWILLSILLLCHTCKKIVHVNDRQFKRSNVN